MHFDTNHVALINNVAWAFATYPDPGLRNGGYAVRLATRACEMTGFRTTVMVGTLAAAYAEAGRFDEAVATGQKACALASELGETNLLQTNQKLVVLYQAHQAYHESTTPNLLRLQLEFLLRTCRASDDQSAHSSKRLSLMHCVRICCKSW